MQSNEILSLSNQYLELIKVSYIKKMPNNKYRVLSEKGKNLGEYPSKSMAEKRLKQVEFFKHRDSHSVNDKAIDLTDVDDISYSAIMRKLRQKANPKQVVTFLKIFKNYFDSAVKQELQEPDKVALQKTLIKFNKIYKIKLDKNMIKSAAISELGNAASVGQYLANIVRFTLNRISLGNRPKAIESLKQKIYNLSEAEIASKKMPASSSMGQSITFIKHVLFNHDANYIREVLNNIVRFL